jgi:SHS2 domain-containing protein
MAGLARHSFDEHVSELAIRIEASSLPGLFEEAGRALAEVMRARPLEPPIAWSEEIVLRASDPEALLVEWLNELVLRSEVAKVVFREFEITHLHDGHLVAVIRGTRVAELRNPVKGATYHGLTFVEHAGRITATIVLDV